MQLGRAVSFGFEDKPALLRLMNVDVVFCDVMLQLSKKSHRLFTIELCTLHKCQHMLIAFFPCKSSRIQLDGASFSAKRDEGLRETNTLIKETLLYSSDTHLQLMLSCV